MSGIFQLHFCFVFIKACILVQQKHGLLDLKKVIIPFKIIIMKKPHIFLLPDLWFLSCNRRFSNSVMFVCVGAYKNWLGTNFYKWEMEVFRTPVFLRNCLNKYLTFLYLWFFEWCEKHPLKEHRCKFEIKKLPKVIVLCIFNDTHREKLCFTLFIQCGNWLK